MNFNKGVSTLVGTIIIVVAIIVVFGGVFIYQYLQSENFDKKENTKDVVAVTSDVCSDSDGGFDVYLKGTVAARQNNWSEYSAKNSGFSATDNCIDGNTLLEYWCLNEKAAKSTTMCDCVDGACKRPTNVSQDIWNIYRNEKYGIELKYLSRYTVSLLGPNQDQLEINNGGNPGGGYLPTHETIAFFKDRTPEAGIDILYKYDEDINTASFMGDSPYLLMGGACDKRQGFVLWHVEPIQFNGLNMVAIEGKKDGSPVNCYYTKTLEGRLIIFSIHNYKIDEIISGLSFVPIKPLTVEQALQGHNPQYWARLTKTGNNVDAPIELYQAINTLSKGDIMEVTFDYSFVTSTGILDVTLNSVVLATLNSKDVTVGLPSTYKIAVYDQSLYGLKDAIFKFRLFGPEGSQILLTNISVHPKTDWGEDEQIIE